MMNGLQVHWTRKMLSEYSITSAWQTTNELKLVNWAFQILKSIQTKMFHSTLVCVWVWCDSVTQKTQFQSLTNLESDSFNNTKSRSDGIKLIKIIYYYFIQLFTPYVSISFSSVLLVKVQKYITIKILSIYQKNK